MIEHLIRWSIDNRVLVLITTVLLIGVGVYSVKNTPIDAIPDLSDVQVIIKTSYPGQAPQVVEDQVTYPLTTAMLSVPGAVNVRGFSFFGDSYVYVIFEDDTDMYWARSRVLEYLSQVSASLPANVQPQLGPDATGVGWVYLYALVDRTGQHDLSQLRSIQDWFLKFELQTVPGVSEVATIGGMVKQYQVTVDPQKLKAFGIPLVHIENAIKRANGEVGASVVEMAEAEYMVRTSGYIKSKSDIEHVPIGLNDRGTPLLLKDIADITIGPQMRRGVAELNGQGETVGGIIVMRYGENAKQTIDKVKTKLADLQSGLPEGVEVVTVYDRSGLIDRAVNNLWITLAIELVVVALVCIIFLMHVQSSLVAVLTLPVGILIAFIVMNVQGINANIMSLGGIAIAIGTMIDGAIVMIENMHKHMESQPITNENRWKIVLQSSVEVGPPLFFSLIIITVSFLPIFALEAQEGRMFAPLAYTKSYSMAAAALLTVTLVPILMGYFIQGKKTKRKKGVVGRKLHALYMPILGWALENTKTSIVIVGLILFSCVWPLKNIGYEFIPALDEGDLMYMPTTYPSISVGKARELLQQTDKLISTVPEVQSVFGKIGRAETATDPAPLTMIETFIQLKPKHEWRPGVTTESLTRELDTLVKLPGVTNAWVMPIKTRIDMLATGVKTPVGVKISGPNLDKIQEIGSQVERLLEGLPGTLSAYSEKVVGGRYIKVDIDREKAARYQLNIQDIQQVVSTAIGGRNIDQSVEGLERYPINIRYPQSYRNTPEKIEMLPIVTPSNERIVLGDVARIYIEDGPPGIKSENARRVGWVFVDIHGVDVGSYVDHAQSVLNSEIQLPAGYSITWAGQYEYMERAKEKLHYIVPLTLVIITVLLFMSFGSLSEVFIVMATLPLALVGSLWLLYLMDFNFSVSVSVGFIALAGIAVETAVIMLVYLNQSWDNLQQKVEAGDALLNIASIKTVVLEGATRRLRPVIMTAVADIAALIPILMSVGTGSEIMSRLAAPMVGGMVTVVVATLIFVPMLYLGIKMFATRGRLERAAK